MGKKIKLKQILLDFFEVLVISSLVFAIVYVFIGQLMEVSGNSMYPTYLDKERIIAEKVSLKYKEIKRGEVVIFQHPTIKERHLLIKRVIALPGETFRISNGFVYINGVKLNEPYLQKDKPTNEIANGVILENVDYTLDSDSYILLGDNRTQSTDSRYFGGIHKENIIGRAFFVYYPLNRIRLLEQR
jgi:signal peptidase I